MVRAEAAEVHYHYDDHDTDYVDETPPIQNTWYEVFDAEDVRLIWCVFRQDNDETVAKNVEIRWTIDGNVYFDLQAAGNTIEYYVYRNHLPSGGGTGGIVSSMGALVAAYHVGKRGKSFKVEIRMTSVPGTNQRLQCWCVRETEDQT